MVYGYCGLCDQHTKVVLDKSRCQCILFRTGHWLLADSYSLSGFLWLYYFGSLWIDDAMPWVICICGLDITREVDVIIRCRMISLMDFYCGLCVLLQLLFPKASSPNSWVDGIKGCRRFQRRGRGVIASVTDNRIKNKAYGFDELTFGGGRRRFLSLKMEDELLRRHLWKSR